MIAKKDLKHGVYYKGTCRNAEEARWDANNNAFVHWRHKFGFKFVEEIQHPDDETRYDVFVAECEVEPKEEIPFLNM